MDANDLLRADSQISMHSLGLLDEAGESIILHAHRFGWGQLEITESIKLASKGIIRSAIRTPNPPHIRRRVCLITPDGGGKVISASNGNKDADK